MSAQRRLALLIIVMLVAFGRPATAKEFKLDAQCPASFELKQGRCYLRTNYDRYSSLENAGVGGLKTGLPMLRDGFSPLEIDLGRYLFFDPVLSADHDLSCASCHNPDQGFADGKARSQNAKRQELPRNAPSLWNVAFLSRLFLDGRATSLESQMQGPLYDAREMANTPQKLLTSLNAIPAYRQLFAIAYKDAGAGIRLDHVYRAIAAFESSLISLNSRYDLYAHGVADALNKNELEGLNVFRSFVARCAECHTPPLFSNQQVAVLGTPEPAGQPFDAGAGAIVGKPGLRGGFKVPSLRNVALTSPYMHSGRFKSLRETVSFYNEGRGHALPKGEKLSLHWHIWEPNLSVKELDRLVDFLKTLTDESFKPQRPSAVPSGLQLK